MATDFPTKDEDKNKISNILGFGAKKADEIRKKFKLETLSDLENYIKKNGKEY